MYLECRAHYHQGVYSYVYICGSAVKTWGKVSCLHPLDLSQLIQVECGGGQDEVFGTERFEFCVETSITY